MASDRSANLDLPYLAAAQAQKHVTHNEALRRLDAYVHLALESITATAPPETPVEGGRWFVPAGATGVFAGQGGKLAAHEAGAFDFLPPPRDALAYIRDEDRIARFDGNDWISLSADSNQMLVMESITAIAPPAVPAEGARWFVPVGGSGAFVGQDGRLATWRNGAFVFGHLPLGTLAFVRDQWRLFMYDGGAFVSPLATRPTRAAIEAEVREEDVIPFGASTDTTIVIPPRAIVLGVSTRTLSGVTGASSYDCGIAGEANKFGGSLGIAQGASNSGVIGPTAFYADTPVRLTANGGTFTGGRVRVSIQMLHCPVPVFPDLEPAWWTGAAYLLDGIAPVLAADFTRERYTVSFAHASSQQVMTRTGGAKWVTGPGGASVLAPANTLAFDYSGGRRCLVLEGAATNLFLGSAAPTTGQSLSVAASAYNLSFEGSGKITLSGAYAGTLSGTGVSNRTSMTFTPAAGTLVVTPSGDVRKVMLAQRAFPTSYVETTTTTVTRTTDICRWSGAAAALLSMAGPCTVALRGGMYLSNAATLIGVGTQPLLLSAATGEIAMHGAAVALSSGVTVGNGAKFGAIASWSTSGRVLSVKNSAPKTDNIAPTYDMSNIFFGLQSGIPNDIRLEIEELLIWPIKGSIAAIQSQARAWS